MNFMYVCTDITFYFHNLCNKHYTLLRIGVILVPDPEHAV